MSRYNIRIVKYKTKRQEICLVLVLVLDIEDEATPDRRVQLPQTTTTTTIPTIYWKGNISINVFFLEKELQADESMYLFFDHNLKQIKIYISSIYVC